MLIDECYFSALNVLLIQTYQIELVTNTTLKYCQIKTNFRDAIHLVSRGRGLRCLGFHDTY